MRKRLQRNKSSARSSGRADVMACVLFPESYKGERGQEPALETSWGAGSRKSHC